MNNEHAATLREMAEMEQVELNEWLESIKSLEDHPLAESYTEYAEQNERKVTALLAGAEALENLEVAKSALRLIQRNRIGDGGPCEFAGQACICSECTATAALSTWTRYCGAKRPCICSECTATAALARLEGK